MTGKMRSDAVCLLLGLLVPVLWASASALGAAETATNQDRNLSARRILDATAVKGGLIVHLGCGDGRLTAALRASDSYLVHGLDVDPANVAEARRYIKSLGAYGPVSVSRFDGKHLPYAGGLVRLLVAGDLGEVGPDEVLRVLCPDGVAYLKKDGQWVKSVKPWPPEIGEWTHFLHDAANNAVAKDVQVGPPARLKWACGPLWSRSHEFKSSLCAMVSAGGRVFYIFDEGLTGVTPRSLPERWILIARDAFSGVLLWKRPLKQWQSLWKSTALRSAPATVPRRIVAQGDRVFMTLEQGAAVSVLDAATGEVLATFEGTEGTEEMRCAEGVLLLCKGKSTVMAIDTKTGEKLWEAPGRIQPISLAARAGKVFFQDAQNLVCLGLKDGKQLWQAPCKSAVSLLIACDDLVLLLSGPRLRAVSAGSGETLWEDNARVSRRELFVAQGRLWHWEGQHIVGRDLRSGKVAARPDTGDVFTRGHHLRCYQSKATERFLITPYRGVEFVSLTGGKNSQHDWTRGPCRYGIMPCNGLLYVPPNPCFCYPGVKLTGFNALGPESKGEGGKGKAKKGGEQIAGARLQRGPAFGAADPTPAPTPPPHSQDWPTYRHDARRTGATACRVAPEVSTRWKANLKGRLTPPVVAENRVYVAAKDAHTLHVLDIKDGGKLWHFTAGGRIDSPPTVCGNLVLFGCADGRVYCLRASDGELAWRFTAAPSDRKIVAFGQLESPWRVHGSVLLKDGVAYCTAGRSTYLDGGIRLFALEPKTGKVLHQTCLDTWSRTRKDAVGKPFIPSYHIEGALSDILVSEGDYIYLGQYKLDRKLARQEVPYVMPRPGEKSKAMGLPQLIKEPYVRGVQSQVKDEKIQHDWQWRVQKELMEEYTGKYGGASMGDRKMGRHVFSTSGFLDDAWYNRTFWMYSETWPGYHIAHLGAKTGQLLSVGDQKTYAVQAYPARNLQSPLFTPGKDGYLLFADDNDNEPVIPDYTRGVPKGIGFTRQRPPVWFHWVPVRIRGMVLAADVLFVAGPPDVVDPDDPMAAFEGRNGAVLQARSAADGKTLAEHRLDAPAVFDGVIAAAGRLLMCSTDGNVICFGQDEQPKP